MKKMMKMFILFLFILLSTTIFSVQAETSDSIEFNNFIYLSRKTRENNKIKVHYQFSFETDVPVVVHNIIYEIKSQKGDINIENKNISREQSYEFTVEDWQTGTLKLKIVYEVVEEGKDPTGEIKYTKTLYLAENSKWKEEVGWGNAIALGIFTTICVVAATSLIISSSKKEYIIKELEEE